MQPLSRRRDAGLQRCLSHAEAELLYLREENTRLRLERACEPPVIAESPADGGCGLDSTLAAEVLLVKERLLEVCERLETALRSARDVLGGPVLLESGGDGEVPDAHPRVATLSDGSGAPM
jgi:hypothetical protein